MIKHISFIMDGNRRWAQSKGLLKVLGHKEGVQTIKKVANFCLNKGIKYLSLYTFSLENFKRSEKEKKYLFNMLVDESDALLKEFKEKEVRAQFVGARKLFPESILPSCNKIEKETDKFDKLHINFLFCYGARQEIISGVKRIASKVKSGELDESDITQETFYNNLWSGNFPEPDLIVRTGGQIRLSNFLLYQAAYSEFCFLDCMWPEIDGTKLEKVFTNYVKRKRNFGV
ncbi:polyprenyl diphosphate synthase [Candidatus Dependentiae bacterium]